MLISQVEELQVRLEKHINRLKINGGNDDLMDIFKKHMSNKNPEDPTQSHLKEEFKDKTKIVNVPLANLMHFRDEVLQKYNGNSKEVKYVNQITNLAILDNNQSLTADKLNKQLTTNKSKSSLTKEEVSKKKGTSEKIKRREKRLL